jgi:hypothetical protein
LRKRVTNEIEHGTFLDIKINQGAIFDYKIQNIAFFDFLNEAFDFVFPDDNFISIFGGFLKIKKIPQ